MALRALSLCAGIGGADLGLRSIGVARTVCYVERESFAAACLVAAMQRGALDDAPIWSDLRSFDAQAWCGTVDLVVAGYPCQPFSHAGRRRGADDERHLWPEVLRITRECGARLLFCENVAGHLSLGFADVLANLAASGFDVEWDLFTAREVGAPHRRERLFFLAHSDGSGLERIYEPIRGEHLQSTERNLRGKWEAEPNVDRVASRIPAGLDRLRALGNAIVPQVAALAWNTLSERAGKKGAGK